MSDDDAVAGDLKDSENALEPVVPLGAEKPVLAEGAVETLVPRLVIPEEATAAVVVGFNEEEVAKGDVRENPEVDVVVAAGVDVLVLVVAVENSGAELNPNEGAL